MPEWHLITGEYPPDRGGVADYSFLVAQELAARGDSVHVWCPEGRTLPAGASRIEVHRDLGRLSRSDLKRVGRLLDTFPEPRNLLVQYVPHAFGYRAMNVGFAAWLLSRSRRSGDRLGIMIHEAHVDFRRSWRENVIAAVNRVMDLLILRAADILWVATPAWERMLRRYSPGDQQFHWLPVPSNIPRLPDAAASQALRSRYNPDGAMVGHFGTYGVSIAPLLAPVIRQMFDADHTLKILLLGRGAADFRRAMIAEHPSLDHRLIAPTALDDANLSIHLAAPDLYIQPYPEGLSARRGSAMAIVSHGRPIVTSRGKYTEEVWERTEAVVLTDLERGPEAIAEAALESLAGDLDEMGHAADRVYREHFALEHTVDAFVEGFRELSAG